jgi:hypothetical protein
MLDLDSRHGRELKAAENFFAIGHDHPLGFYAQLLSTRRRAERYLSSLGELMAVGPSGDHRALSQPINLKGTSENSPPFKTLSLRWTPSETRPSRRPSRSPTSSVNEFKGRDAQSPSVRRVRGHPAADDARGGALGHGGPVDDHRRRAAGTCRHTISWARGRQGGVGECECQGGAVARGRNRPPSPHARRI